MHTNLAQLKIDQKNWIGDALLTFNSEREAYPGRMDSQGWSASITQENWRLLVQDPCPAWKGFPCRFLQSDHGNIWLLGEIYPHHADAGDRDEQLQEFVLGSRPASWLNGHFLILAWESLTKTWHCWTDRFGTLHAYYATDGKRAALGTFFPAVAQAASQRRLDWPGLIGFLAFGFFPQDRTYFDDVRILRPASHYIFDEQGAFLSQGRYWEWRHEPDKTRSYDDTVAAFASIFKEILHDQVQGGRIAIPISGGLDSRSTVAAITDSVAATPESPPLWSYSYGYGKNSLETRIAGSVARSRALPFSAFEIHPYLFDNLDLVTASVEGFQDLTQCRQAAVVKEIARQADYLIAAHWGDVWLDDMGLTEARSEKSGDYLVHYALHKMMKNGRWWLLNTIESSPNYPKDFQALLGDMVRQELAQVAHLEDLDFHLKAFKTDQWSFRWTVASLRMFQAAAFPRLPFYDTRLTDFMGSVPSEFVKKRRLQVDYLKRFAPDLARVTWQVYDTHLFGYQHFHTWLLPKRALKKAWRMLRGKAIVERNWEVQFLNNNGRQGLEHWLLRPGLRLHEFFQPSALRAFMDDFYADPWTEGRGYTVSMLLTFSVWLERYG